MFELLTFALFSATAHGVPNAVLDTVLPLVEHCPAVGYAGDLYFWWLVGDEGKPEREFTLEEQRKWFTETPSHLTPERPEGVE